MTNRVSTSVKIIDLSLPLTPDSAETTAPRIHFTSHRRGARLLSFKPLIIPRHPLQTARNLLGYLTGSLRIPPSAFPEGSALAWETVHAMTHRGTHVDAPLHYGPTSGGEPAKSIDRVPVDWFWGDGVVLDMRAKQAGDVIEPEDVNLALQRVDYELKPGDIPLVMTGADRHWGTPEYLECYPGLSAAAVHWLLDQGVRVIGIDADSLDRPGSWMLRDFQRTGDGGQLWPAHFVGREREYCQIENLSHLDAIPIPHGFTVAAFPVRIDGATAAWARVVAILAADECAAEEKGASA